MKILFTKTYVTTTLLLCFYLNGFSLNVTIMESQSFHPAQTMDLKWHNTAVGLGYNSSIENYDLLDDPCNLEETDILILSSGLIELTSLQLQTVKSFVAFGGQLYVQAEYLFTHSGNKIFTSLVTELGGNFTWTGQGTGQQVPMYVSGPIKDSYNTVNLLSYFWFGTYGEGDHSVQPFLSHQGNDYGFIFNSDNPFYGKIVTNSDQDWVRNNSNISLLENILKYLESEVIDFPLPEVSITSSAEESCAGEIVTFNAEILNYRPGVALQWTINGQPITGQHDTLFVTVDLMDGDVVECILQMDQLCGMHQHVSNPILMTVVYPISTPSLEISTIKETYCEGEVATFLATASDLSQLDNVSFQWLINGQPLAGANQALFNTAQLQNNDEVSCELAYQNACTGPVAVLSETLRLTILDRVEPTVVLTADQTLACEGTPITFTVAGSNLGNTPTYDWTIDGVSFPATENTIVLNNLEDGQEVNVIVTGSAACATATELIAQPIAVNIIPAITPMASIHADKTNLCTGEETRFFVTGNHLGLNPSYEWSVDGIVSGPDAPEYITNNLWDGANVLCRISVSGQCLSTNLVTPNPIQVQVNEIVNPELNIDANTERACEGSSITFTATGEYWGAAPVFQWAVNGALISNSTSSLEVENYQTSDEVSLLLVSNELCAAKDSLNAIAAPVEVSPIQLTLSVLENEHCGMKDGLIEAEATGGFAPLSYSWDNGQTGNYQENLAAGNYQLVVTDQLGCTATVTATLESESAPVITEINSTPALCENVTGSAQVNTLQEGEYTYHWHFPNGEIQSTTEGELDLPAGLFEVEVEDAFGCISADRFEVERHSPVKVDLGEDREIMLGERVELSPLVNLPGELEYEWSVSIPTSDCLDCSELTAQPTADVVYSVMVTNEFGCTAVDEVEVKVLPNERVFIPNVFSPNGDGTNDYFTVFGGSNLVEIVRLQVFDRWGNVLVEKRGMTPNAETEGWDGFAHGKLLDKGVYVYIVQLQFLDGTHTVETGDVSIF